jgi:hypothetical protein
MGKVRAAISIHASIDLVIAIDGRTAGQDRYHSLKRMQGFEKAYRDIAPELATRVHQGDADSGIVAWLDHQQIVVQEPPVVPDWRPQRPMSAAEQVRAHMEQMDLRLAQNAGAESFNGKLRQWAEFIKNGQKELVMKEISGRNYWTVEIQPGALQ